MIYTVSTQSLRGSWISFLKDFKRYELVAGFDVEGLRLEVRNMLERRPQSVAFHPLLQKVVSRKFGFCKCVNL